MDKASAKTLLTSLLERLDADAQSKPSKFEGLVSASERAALRVMVENWGRERNDPTSAPEETPGLIHDPEPDTEEPVVTNQPVPLEMSPVAREDKVRIDETVLGLETSPEPEWVLCLDFGTAKSKAFAANNSGESDFLEIPLGKMDGDHDKSVYAVSSSVWIDDEGLVFAGSEAVQRGMNWVHSGTQRHRRLDSLKQEISQVLLGGGERRPLEQDVNPTSVRLTYEDTITFYLAYLTDLATTELESKVGTRYVRRKFTLPWWEENQRRWAGKLLSQNFARAQVLADTFHGKWHAGIHVSDLKSALNQTTKHHSSLMWLLAREKEKKTWSLDQWGGVLEPLAAASSRVWADRSDRELILVVDVGAGTTDYSLFWTTQNLDQRQLRKAFPVVNPCGGAIRQAGDTLDSLLVKELLSRANLGADPDLKKRVSDGLYRGGVRQLKERLFEVGEFTEVLANDDRVSLTIDEFLTTDGVDRFSANIRQSLRDLLSKVHPSWAKSVKDHALKLVLTGGGSGLPMIRSLVDENWSIAGTSVACRLAKDLPDLIAKEFDANFAQEYPQLAVAMGGAMPMLLDEGRTQLVWAGDAPSPGPLTRYPTRGI